MAGSSSHGSRRIAVQLRRPSFEVHGPPESPASVLRLAALTHTRSERPFHRHRHDPPSVSQAGVTTSLTAATGAASRLPQLAGARLGRPRLGLLAPVRGRDGLLRVRRHRVVLVLRAEALADRLDLGTPGEVGQSDAAR